MRIENLSIDESKNRPEETVFVIARLVRSSIRSPYIRSMAEEALTGLPEHDREREALRLFDAVRGSMRYVQDPVDLEFVKDPAYSARWLHDNPGQLLAGDCDDHVALLAALLRSVGFSVRLVIVRTTGGAQPGDYNHIYLKVFLPESALADGEGFVSLDPIVKDKPAGWATEHEDIKEFDI